MKKMTQFDTMHIERQQQEIYYYLRMKDTVK